MLKGRVHQEIKIQSLSTHPRADRRWVKIFSPQNTAGISQEKGVAVISSTIEVNGDLYLNVKNPHNKTKKCLHTARVKSSKCPEALHKLIDADVGAHRHTHRFSMDS